MEFLNFSGFYFPIFLWFRRTIGQKSL